MVLQVNSVNGVFFHILKKFFSGLRWVELCGLKAGEDATRIIFLLIKTVKSRQNSGNAFCDRKKVSKLLKKGFFFLEKLENIEFWGFWEGGRPHRATS